MSARRGGRHWLTALSLSLAQHCLARASGANFEYGSLTWEPVTGIEPYRDPLHGGFAVVDDAGQAAVPVINNTWAPDQGDSLNQWAVEFTLKTHWQLDEALDVGAPLAQLDRDGVVLANLTDAPSVAQVTDWLTSVSGGSYRIRIAPRVKDSEDISSFLVSRKDEDDYYPAVGFEYDAQTHLAMLAAADKTHVRGPQCIAPADDGDSPACGVSHTYAATSGGTLTSSRGLAAIGPCQGRDIKMTRDEYGSHIVDAAASPFFPVGCCDVDTMPDYCVPAAAISGFFPGDGTFQAVDLMLDRGGVQDMLLGKVFTATAKMHHIYKARKRSDGKPFTAYFTGGTRGHALQSSAASRVRLETTVNIQARKQLGQDSLLCRGTGSCNPWNRPPIATAPSIIPVPYTGRGQGFATFQITAFDPDMQSVAGGQMRTEDVLYRFATEEEMSGVSAGCLATNSKADSEACSDDWLGLDMFSSAGDNLVDYASKHIRAVVLYCKGTCDTCQECDKIPKSDPSYFSCFDCKRYPPAYSGVTCGDLDNEVKNEVIAGVATDDFCGGQSKDTPLVDLVDTDNLYRNIMKAFHNVGDYSWASDPMGRYRTKENENYKGRGLREYTFQPRIPDDMHIDPYTGIITWETGISPYHIDHAPYPDPAKQRPSGLAADPSHRASYTMLQPASQTSPQHESGPNVGPVVDAPSDKAAVLDVIFNAGGGYSLTAARCYAKGESTAPDSVCLQSAANFEDLDAEDVRAVYQGSGTYEDIYCQTQQGYAGVWGSGRHYRTAQGCIRRFPDSSDATHGEVLKKPAAPGIYPVTVVAYSKSHDAFGSDSFYKASEVRGNGTVAYANGLDAEDITMLHDQAYVKSTISLNVYLYPAMHYCARGCDNYAALKRDVEQWEADPASVDMNTTLSSYGVRTTKSDPEDSAMRWPLYGYPNRFTMESTLDDRVLDSPSHRRGRLGDDYVSVPRFASPFKEDAHGAIMLPQLFPNLGGTGQCAFCGGGSAQGELLDASWCSPTELPAECKDGVAPLGVRRARFPPASSLDGDDDHFSMMSMRSAERPVYVCDASYSGIPGMVATMSTPNADGIAPQSYNPESGWERLNDTTDNYAWSNANKGVFLTWDRVGTDVPSDWDAGNALTWGFQPGAEGHPWSTDASYTPAWGFSYVRPTCQQEAAQAAAGVAAQLYPTTGSCYVNQPPYWVEECHYGNTMRDTYAPQKWDTPLMFTPMQHVDESSIFARATFTYDTEAWITLTARDDDDCVELAISAIALDAESGQTFTEQNAPHEWSFESPSCNADAAINSRPLKHWHGAAVTPADRGALYSLDATKAADYRQVKRTFRWPMQVRKTPRAWQGTETFAERVARCQAYPELCTAVDCRVGSELAGTSICARAASDGFAYLTNDDADALGSCEYDVMWQAKEAGEKWWLKCPNARDLRGLDVKETDYEAARAMWHTGELDERPQHSYVCFVATDGYLHSPHKCVHIEFVSKGALRWMDDRNWDDECIKRPEMPTWAAGDVPVNNTEFWVAPGNTLQVELSAYDSSGRMVTIEQVRGQPLRDINATGAAHVEWIPIDHVYDTASDVSDSVDAVMWSVSPGAPSAASFESGDPLKLPVASISGRDPLRSLLRFTPRGGRECSYKLCFRATSQDGTHALWQHADDVLQMDCALEEPDERCFTIHVADQAAHLKAAAIDLIATPALRTANPVASSSQDCTNPGATYGGLTYAAWVYPSSGECGTPVHVMSSFVKAEGYETLQSLSLRKSCFTGRYAIEVSTMSTNGRRTTTREDALTAGEWHHLRLEVLQYSSPPKAVVKVFIDGSASPISMSFSGVVASASSAGSDVSAAGLRIGSDFVEMGEDALNAGTFYGYIADVAIYNSSFGGAFDHLSDYDGLPDLQRRRLVGFWRMSDGVRHTEDPGIGDAHLQAPLAHHVDAEDTASVTYLQYPWWDRYLGRTPLRRGHVDAASYQHAIAKYAALAANNGTAAADAQSLADPTVALMSIRTAAQEMAVRNADTHVIREASGAVDVSARVILNAATGTDVRTLTYDFVATPGSGVCPLAAVPNTLLAYEANECTAVFGTHERAFAPSAAPTCSFGSAAAVSGVAIREPGSDAPWAPALKCCVKQAHAVQRPALTVSNSGRGPPAQPSLAVGFLDMSLLMNVDLSVRKVPSTRSKVNASLVGPDSLAQWLDLDTAALRIIDGSLQQHAANETAAALVTPFTARSSVFPAATVGKVHLDANLVGAQYVRGDGVLDDLATEAHGFATEGWFYQVTGSEPEARNGSVWLVGWTAAHLCNATNMTAPLDADGAATGLTAGAALYITSKGELEVVERAGDRMQAFKSTARVTTDSWHHVLLTLAADLSGAVYLDGKKAVVFQLARSPEAVVGNVTDVLPTFALGGVRWHDPAADWQELEDLKAANSQAVQPFTGMLDDWSVWAKELTADDLCLVMFGKSGLADACPAVGVRRQQPYHGMVARWQFNDKAGAVVASSVTTPNNALDYIGREITDNAAHLTTAVCPPCSGADSWGAECSDDKALHRLPEYVGWHSADFIYTAAPYHAPATAGNKPRCKRPVGASMYYSGVYAAVDKAARNTLSCSAAAQRLSDAQATSTNLRSSAADAVELAALVAPDAIDADFTFCEWARLQVGGSARLVWDHEHERISGVGLAPGEPLTDLNWLPSMCAEYEAEDLHALTHPGQREISVRGYGFSKSSALSARITTMDDAALSTVEFRHLTQVDVSTTVPSLQSAALSLSNSVAWTDEVCAADAMAAEMGSHGTNMDIPLRALERALFCDGNAATSNVPWAACKRAEAPSVSAWVMPVRSLATDITSAQSPRIIFRAGSPACFDDGELFAVEYVPFSGRITLRSGERVADATAIGEGATLLRDTWHFVEVQTRGRDLELWLDNTIIATLDMASAPAVHDPRLQVCGAVCGTGWDLSEPTISRTFQGYISQLRVSSEGVSDTADMFRPYAEIAGGAVCADDRCVPTHGKCSSNGAEAFAPCCSEDEACFEQEGSWGQCLPKAANGDTALLLARCDKTTEGQPRLDRPECSNSEEGALQLYDQCSDDGETTTGVCAAGYVCMKRNDYYGQCMRPDDIGEGWDGSVIARELCSVKYLEVDSVEAITEFGVVTDCVTKTAVVDEFERCSADGITSLGACEAGTQCVRQHKFYGQCITPDERINRIDNSGWDGDIIAPEACMTRRINATRCGVTYDCLDRYDQCSADGQTTLGACCTEGDKCYRKDAYFGMCVDEERLEQLKTSEGWDGGVIADGKCETFHSPGQVCDGFHCIASGARCSDDGISMLGTCCTPGEQCMAKGGYGQCMPPADAPAPSWQALADEGCRLVRPTTCNAFWDFRAHDTREHRQIDGAMLLKPHRASAGQYVAGDLQAATAGAKLTLYARADRTSGQSALPYVPLQFIPVPWQPAQISFIGVRPYQGYPFLGTDGGDPVYVEGANLAPSAHAQCEFQDSEFAVEYTAISARPAKDLAWSTLEAERYTAGHGACPIAPFAVPGSIAAGAANSPISPDSGTWPLMVQNTAAVLRGGHAGPSGPRAVKHKMVHRSATFPQLSCPEGLAIASIRFADWGQPTARCNYEADLQPGTESGTCVEGKSRLTYPNRSALMRGKRSCDAANGLGFGFTYSGDLTVSHYNRCHDLAAGELFRKGVCTQRGDECVNFASNATCSLDAERPGALRQDLLRHCAGKTQCYLDLSFDTPETCNTTTTGDDHWLAVEYTCTADWIARDHISGGDITPMNGTFAENGYTWALWINPAISAGDESQTVVAFEAPTGSALQFRSGLIWTKLQRGCEKQQSCGTLAYFDACIDSARVRDEDGQDLYVQADTWTHIAVSLTPEGEGTIYMDGQRAAHFSTKCRIDEGSKLFLGADHVSATGASQNYFQGQLDNFMLWNSVVDIATAWHNDTCPDRGLHTNATSLVIKYGMSASPAGGVASVQNHAPGGNDGQFLVSESILSGCALSYEELACGVRRAVYDNGCNYASEDEESDLTIHAVDPTAGTLCEGLDVLVAGVHSASVVSAHVDSQRVPIDIVNGTHISLTFPPASTAEILDSHIVGMQLNSDAVFIARSLVLNTTASTLTNGAPFVIKTVVYSQHVQIADLSCSLRDRYLFTGELASLTELEDRGGFSTALTRSPSTATFTAGRHGFNRTALNATASPTLLDIGMDLSENYTIAAWIQLPQVEFDKAPDYWMLGPRIGLNGTNSTCGSSNSTYGPAESTSDHATHLANSAMGANCTCGSHYSHEIPDVPPCIWKFVALRVANHTRTLTVGNAIMDPDHAIANLLTPEDGQLNVTGVIVDELTVWDRVLFDEELLRLLATDSYAVRVGANSRTAMEFLLPAMSDPHSLESYATGVAASYWQPSEGVTYGNDHIAELGSTEPVAKHFLPGGLDAQHAAGEGPYATSGSEAVYDCVVTAARSGEQHIVVEADDGVAIYLNGTEATVAGGLTYNSTDNVALNRTVTYSALVPGEPGHVHLRIVHRNNAADGTSIRLLTNSTSDVTALAPAVCSAASGGWSLAAWIRPEETVDSGDEHYLFASSEWSVSVMGASLRVQLKRNTCQDYTPPSTAAGPSCARTDTFTLPNVGLQAGSWNHLVITVSEASVNAYVGGQLRAAVAVDTSAHRFGAAWPDRVVTGSFGMGRPAHLLLHSVRLVARAITAEDVMGIHACDTAEVDNTIAFYIFDEGFGDLLEEASGETPYKLAAATVAYGKLWASEWVDVTCSDAPASNETVHVCDSPHKRGMVAGKPVKYALQARDACGKTHRAGGHCVAVIATHTNGTSWAASSCVAAANMSPLGGEIVAMDMADGSYEITQLLTLAGNYSFTIFLDSDIVVNETLTVHPGVADAGMSWVEEITSPGGLTPLSDATVGVPAKLRVHLVDQFGNVKDWSDMAAGEFDVEAAFSVTPGPAPAVYITDAGEGTVDVDFMPMVAGFYQLHISLCGEPLCLADPLDGCKLCFTAEDTGALSLSRDGPWATFAPKPALDLLLTEHSYTIAAWIRKPNATNGTEATNTTDFAAIDFDPEYIVSRVHGIEEGLTQGYALHLAPVNATHGVNSTALNRTNALNATMTNYTVTLDVWYPASNDTELVSVEATVGLPPDIWVRIVATISSTFIQIYKVTYNESSGVELTTLASKSVSLDVDVTSVGSLHVGQRFEGDIDSVLITTGIASEAELKRGAMCAYGDAEALADLRFNEKGGPWTATHTAARDAAPGATIGNAAERINAAYEQHFFTHGVVGLLYGAAPVGDNLTLACPNDDNGTYVIHTILLADLGNATLDIDGVYTAGNCSHADAALQLVTEACLDQPECTINVNATALSAAGKLSPCAHSLPRRIVVAVSCSPDEVWTDDAAPSHVGEANLEHISLACPNEVVSLLPADISASWHAHIEEECADFDPHAARATVGQFFGVHLWDKCGFKDLWPINSGGAVIDGELAFDMQQNAAPGSCEANVISTKLMRSDEFDDGDTPSDVAPEAKGNRITEKRQFKRNQSPGNEPLHILRAGNESSPVFNSSHCRAAEDPHLFKYLPLHAGNATLRIAVDGWLVYEQAVVVSPGPASAQNSDLGGSALALPTAGQPATLVITVKDAASNTLDMPCKLFREHLTIDVAPAANVSFVDTSALGICELTVTYLRAGTHTVSLSTPTDGIDAVFEFVGDGNSVSREVEVSAGIMLHADPVRSLRPEGRAATAAAACGDDIVLFGGADARRSYAGDTWRFRDNGDDALFTFATPLLVTGGEAAGPFTERLMLDTATLIAKGQLRSDCTDLMFASASGMPLPYWLDPVPGCNTERTVIWLQLPDGENVIMYHGGTRPVEGAGRQDTPAALVEWFESFEYVNETRITDVPNAGWQLVSAYEGCGPRHEQSSATSQADVCTAPGDGAKSPVATADAFKIHCSEFSITGGCALRADSSSVDGGAVQRALGDMLKGQKYMLRGYLMDECGSLEGSHWMSPDFRACLPGQEAPHMTAAGVRSLVSDNYVVGVPWKGTHVPRTAAWHTLTIVQTDTGFTTLIDDVVVREHVPTLDEISSVLLQTGHMIAGAPGGTALWDAFMLLPVHTNTSVTAATHETVPAHTRLSSRWQEITGEESPTSRQGHTMTSVADNIYLFGGERTGYMYSDLWRYDCATDVWEFVKAHNRGPEGRYAHAAAAVNDTSLCVIGGRGVDAEALGDAWCMNVTATPPVWRRIDQAPGAERYSGFKGRQGHSAVAYNSTLVVFGGYITEDAALTAETWLFDTAASTMQNLGPLTQAFTAPADSNPTQGIIMPQAVPEARMDHAACFAHGKLWVIGGSTGALATYPAGDAWVLDLAERTWELVSEDAGRPYFNGAVVCEYSAGWLLHGGNEEGTYSAQLKRVHLSA